MDENLSDPAPLYNPPKENSPPAYLLIDPDKEMVPYTNIYINQCATGLRKKKGTSFLSV